MSTLKQHVVSQVIKTLVKRSAIITTSQLTSQVSVGSFDNGKSEFLIRLPLSFNIEDDREVESVHFHDLKITPDEIIKDAFVKDYQYNKRSLCVKVDQNKFIKDVLEGDVTKISSLPKKQNVIVEFSSPNIAKPFHAGHLRSTIIGNFVSNLKTKLNQNVIKMNYLGDWGTQFGLLKYGVKKCNYTDEMLEKDPIKLLFQAYVCANKESKLNPEVMEAAKDVFLKLESGDANYTNDWNKYREYTLEELKTVYQRLNITFDDYSWESDYSKNNISSVLETLESQGLIKTDEKFRTVTMVNDKSVPLIKSDGSTLYLMRDVAAAIHRQSKFNFDEMYYVVENGQNEHLTWLFSICERIHLRSHWKMKHVKFGRVQGMSTRQGDVVFLKDILNEARSIMYQRQLATHTTKVDVTEEIADILGVSAVVINDLKQNRLRNYEFKWERALQTSGESGIRLQYSHCRLYSLLQNSNATLPRECDPQMLKEPVALALVQQIARYEEILYRSDQDLEASLLVHYLFQLCSTANRAFKVLTVKGQERHLASQRLLLFNTCRLVLADGMKILGLTPLNQM